MAGRATSVWNAFADQAQLELALVNLIINARDAMPAGGTVTVSASRTASSAPAIGRGCRPANMCCCRVTDTGTGISPDDLEKVMEPFFTTKEVGKGSGLGLSMVYGFAKQSNGAFRIDSELGTGTTAELWLPRAPEGTQTESARRRRSRRRKSSRKLRILLVDDHAEVRSTTAAVLEDLGHSVVEAANGADALQSLKDGDCGYDLMISDYAMPHLSGTEFLREAREMCPEVPGADHHRLCGSRSDQRSARRRRNPAEAVHGQQAGSRPRAYLRRAAAAAPPPNN